MSTAASTACFTSAGIAYFKTRGIDPGLAARYGVYEDRGAIIWPTVDADGNPSPRRLTLNGDGPKVRAAAGSGRSRMCTLPVSVPSLVKVGPRAIIVEENRSMYDQCCSTNCLRNGVDPRRSRW